jgi:hypothetical protein
MDTSGDNAFSNGTDNEFNRLLMPMALHLKNTINCAQCNHDYANSGARRTITTFYYSIFTLPTNAECGGVPSGKTYYSFDIGDVHLSLDSMKKIIPGL